MTLKTDKIYPKNGLVGDGGGIIQIKQSILTATATTTTSGSWTDVGLSCAITPLSLIHISEPTRPY